MSMTIVEPNVRLASFLSFFCKKLFVYACGAVIVLIALAIARTQLDIKYEITLDYIMVGSSVVFLCIFGFRLIKAWFKSGVKVAGVTQEKLVYCAIGSFVVLIAAAICFVVIYIFLIKLKYPKLDQRGLFGDSFGALNSIVSSVALIGLWLTVWLQFRQAQDDRKRGLEHDEAERKWREEELRNQRRVFWPVVLISHVSGQLGPLYFNVDGSIVVNMQMRLEYTNISNVPLFNVAMITNCQGIMEDGVFSRAEGPIATYLGSNSAEGRRNKKRLKLDFMEKSKTAIKIAGAFMRGKERVVDVQIFFSAAQGFYYCLEERLRICLADQKDVEKIKNWDEAVATAFSVNVGQEQEIGPLRMEIFENKLKSYGSSSADKIQLAFEAQPLKHEMREITKQEYHDMIAACPYPVLKGGV